MRPLIFALASALLIMSAGAVLSDSRHETAIPQPQPVVIGTVSSTTAHTVKVTTTDGETMTFEFDSRTVKPSPLTANTPVRVEFRLLESGLHLAQRITPLEPSSSVYALEPHALRVQHASRAAAANHKDHEKTTNRQTVMNGKTAPKHESAGSSASEGGTSAPTRATSAPANNSRGEQQLPQTASELPWALSLGMLLLITSAALWLWRRRTAV